jgi:hypothetical protein
MRWILIPAVLMFLSLAACGSSGPEPQAEATLEDPAAVELQEPTATSAPASNLICENPPPQEIGIGMAVEAEIADPHWELCYWVEIPAGLSSVTFHLDGLSADLNLNVGYGYVEVLQYIFGEYWSSRESGTVPEVLVIENPTPGPYFIKVGIAGPKEPSPFALSVTTEPETTGGVTGAALPSPDECGGPAQELALGEAVQDELTDRDGKVLSRQYYCVMLPDGLSRATFELSGLSGFLEIFVRHDQPAQWMDRGRQGETRTVTIEDPAPGPYYIDVAAAVAGTSSPYTLTVSGQ